MLLLDANIPMYAEGREHRYQQPCKRVMELAKANSSAYCIDTEALQEILYVYFSRGETARGIGVAQDILGMFPTIIPITVAEISAAMRLIGEIRQLVRPRRHPRRRGNRTRTGGYRQCRP